MQSDQSLNQLTTSATIGQILSAFEPAAGLLKSIGLDPSHYQGQTLRSVCQQRQWSEEEVLQWLKNQALPQNGSLEEDHPKGPTIEDELTEWCDYLEKTYYRPAFDLLESIDEKFPRVKKIHGNQYLWLKTMQWHFEQFDEALRLYLNFVNQKFFPLVRKIDEVKKQVLDGTVRNLKHSQDIIEQDQHRLRERMNMIREKGHGFHNPEGACSTFRILNYQFRQLDSQLEEQFEVERKQFLPLVWQRLEAI